MTRLAHEPDLLAPVAPFDAYREDVARLGGRSPIGAADDAWLIAAHALARAASLGHADRPALLAAGGDAVQAVVAATRGRHAADDDAATRALDAAAAAGDALHALGRLLGGASDGDRESAVAALQRLVAEQEMAGAFRLALTNLAALRLAAAPILGARCEGLLLAQQGRAARQLGALEAARESYRAALDVARPAHATDVRARALLGMGVVANMRGNYPEARRCFRRAVVAARRAGSVEMRRAAHQGLFIAAVTAGDIETALPHGWAALRQTSPDAPDQRAEALVNLAEAGHLAGEHRAALSACLGALELSDLARIRLPAIGAAARAAAALGERRLVEHLARDLERTIGRSGQPFENAQALAAFAEALLAIGDPRAAEYAARSSDLAAAGAFHEVRLRAERVTDAVSLGAQRPTRDAARARRVAAPQSPRVQAVLRTLEALPAARRYAERLAR
ncbi:hypothetical protein J421_6322 (plasmid) [Gemmatirosa kalamazoonensis]|uniref:Tetratricopeptide repeat-containing protein n=1 Tax=Gemmatirosa kalamazoonensis TaxID=861299 RepID=W0RTR9_9BACT|nr:tetratricopeptide repeat protein [Gemmatirosa kalamazoonensis]AHG93857.1 hypothetical protein J421_6322 [Gemmatirosa kalamazoonensis]